MKTTSQKLIISFFILIAGLMAYMLLQKTISCSIWGCIDFPGKSAYTLTNEYEKTPKVYRALFSNGKEQVRIEAYREVTARQAADYNGYKSMQILGLYETARSPYPGAISDQITCESKFKPVFRKTDASSPVVFSGSLNARLQYGSCIEDQIVYSSTGLMMYCGNRNTWYYLEFIYPKGSGGPGEALTQSVKCL